MSHTKNKTDDIMYSNSRKESPDPVISGSCRTRWNGPALKKGPWTTAEDAILVKYVEEHGDSNWNAVQKFTGLPRCGKSCRLRWANHLRPDLKKGAFSQEEEDLIVEMHAEMGNKWAYMAAHLSGRTDNEIKNYWNTRTKRRLRAGLPLYPPEMHVVASQWNQEYSKSEITRIDKTSQDFLQIDNLEADFGTLPNVSDLPDMPPCNIMGSLSHYENIMPPIIPSPKRIRRESEFLFPGYYNYIQDGYTLPEDLQIISPQKTSKYFEDPPAGINQHSSEVIPGSLTLMDAIFPTSNPSSAGTEKLELPSFQYPETDFDQWKAPSSPPSDLLESADAYIQSPSPLGKEDGDCYSSSEFGILDMFLHEANMRIGTKNGSPSSEMSIVSTTTPKRAEDAVTRGGNPRTIDSLKPVAHSENSFSVQIGAGESSSGEVPLPTENFYGHNGKLPEWDHRTWTPNSENELDLLLDITQPDIRLATSWLDHSFALLSDSFGNDYMNITCGTSSPSPSPSSLSDHARVAGSCSWSKIPQVCDMTELP